MKLALFDCDGTLVDSQDVIVTSMVRAYQSAGMVPPPRERILGIVGLSLVTAIRRLGDDDPAFPAEDLAERYKHAFHALRDEPDFNEPLYPGIRTVLDELTRRDDVILGMATGKAQRGVARVLAHHGLEGRFLTIQTADDAPSKPHPAMVHQAMTAVGVTSTDTIMIGDTSFDMTMGRAAGAGAMGVTWGYHTRDVLEAGGAEKLVDSADVLLAALDVMWDARANAVVEVQG